MRDQKVMRAGMRNKEFVLCGVRIIEAHIPKNQDYPKNHAETRFFLTQRTIFERFNKEIEFKFRNRLRILKHHQFKNSSHQKAWAVLGNYQNKAVRAVNC